MVRPSHDPNPFRGWAAFICTVILSDHAQQLTLIRTVAQLCLMFVAEALRMIVGLFNPMTEYAKFLVTAFSAKKQQ